jgi:NADH-quinone oxidoreductase subunit N
MRMLVDGLEAVQPDWQGMLVILAVLSMGLGNLVAIAQTNIKRMLAYSTISHVGFIFLGLLAGSAQGYSAAMFYAIVYAVMSTGAFGILLILSRQGLRRGEPGGPQGTERPRCLVCGHDGAGDVLHGRRAPTVGFMAKLLVLEAVVRIDMVWLALVAVIFSIIGAFYYLRIVKLIYFDKPDADMPVLTTSGGVRVAMSLNGLSLLALGIFPATLLSWCQSAFVLAARGCVRQAAQATMSGFCTA